MSFDVIATEPFERKLKKLAKKHKSLKADLSDIIDQLTISPEVEIKKSVALKDIRFSNSMVEAANKLLKYRYLFPGNIQDVDPLKTILEKLSLNSMR